MKKFRSVLASAAVLCAMSVSAFAAPVAGDLAASLVRDGNIVAVGFRDAEAFMKSPDDSLLMRLFKMAPAQYSEGVRKVGSIDFRVNLNDKGKVGLFAGALEIREGADLQALLAGGSLAAPAFSVSAPEGMKITPLGSVSDADLGGEGVGPLNVALLERDGARYLIAAGGEASNLAVMAAAEEKDPLAGAKTPANFFVQALFQPSLFEGALTVPLRFELGLDDTPHSLKLHFWGNLSEEISSLIGRDILSVMNGGGPSLRPMLFGKKGLGLLANLSASFLPENFRLADLLGPEMAAGVEGELSEPLAMVGLDLNDVLSVLRGNVTLGLSGALSVPGVGDLPGAYLHLSGLKGEKAAALVNMAAEQLKVMAGEPVPFASGAWQGKLFSSPVPVLAASGDEGLLVAVMNADSLVPGAELAPGLARAAEPHNMALGLDIRVLQPVISDVLTKYGDMIYGMAGEEITAYKEQIAQFVNTMGVMDAVALYDRGADCMTLELTPNAAMVNLFLPAVK